MLAKRTRQSAFKADLDKEYLTFSEGSDYEFINPSKRAKLNWLGVASVLAIIIKYDVVFKFSISHGFFIFNLPSQFLYSRLYVTAAAVWINTQSMMVVLIVVSMVRLEQN